MGFDFVLFQYVITHANAFKFIYTVSIRIDESIKEQNK